MGNKNNIDQLFKDKLKGYTAEPAEDGWALVRERINKRERRKRMAVWRYSTMAAAVLLAFFTGYYFNNDTPSPEELLKETGTPVVDFDELNNQLQESGVQSEAIESNEAKEPIIAGNSALEATAQETEPIAKSSAKSLSNNDHLTSVKAKPIADDATIDLENGTQNLATNTESLDEAYDLNQTTEPTNKTAPITPVETDEPSNATKPISSELITAYHLEEDAPPLIKPRKINANSYRVGLAAGPTVPFRDVTLKTDNELTQFNVDNESLANTYAAGIKVAYQASEKWELQAGLTLNNWDQTSSNVLLASEVVTQTPGNAQTVELGGSGSFGSISYTDGQKIQTDLTPIGNPSPITGGSYSGDSYRLNPDIRQQYQFIEVPVTAAYYLLQRKFSVKLLAGLNSKILTQSNAFLQFEDGSTESYDNIQLNNFSLQLMGGPGFGYQFTNRLSLNVEPLIYYGITPVFSSDQVDTYFHQFLVFTGFSYTF